MTILHTIFTSVAPFFILLGLLIFVHELGHFLVAKYYGVRVETFSLGFGKKLLAYKRGDTTYCISMIPLGGYVKMYGDDPTADVPAEERKYAFLHKPVMQRVAVVLAGPLMNLFFAILLFTVISGIGEEMPGPFAGDISVNSRAYEVGFRSGDRIAAINNEPMPSWVHVRKKIEESAGQALDFTIERKTEPQPLQIQAAINVGENENIFASERQVGQVEGLTAESRSTLVGVKDPNSPAAQSGIRSLDLIVGVNGQKISFWRDLEPMLKQAVEAGAPFQIQVREVTLPETDANTRSVTIDPTNLGKAEDFTAALGVEPAELYIYQLKKGSPADKAGVKSKDKVVRINGEEVQAWNEVLARVKSYNPEKHKEGIEFTVLRDGEENTYKIVPEMTKLMTMKGQEEKRYTIGIISGFLPATPDTVLYRVSGPVAMLKQGVKDTVMWTEFVVMSLVRLVQGEVSAKNVGGVITIGRVASHSFAAGLSTFLKTMAIISINLFLLNLLPVPVLDGGHLLFYAIEVVKGNPLSMRKMELAQQIGLMLLMILMVFAFFNDITNLLNRW